MPPSRIYFKTNHIKIKISISKIFRTIVFDPIHSVDKIDHNTTAACRILYHRKYFCTQKKHLHKADALLTGNFLSSQGVSTQVLSASECLTTVFGMGTGGTIQASSPDMWDILSKLYRRRNVEHFSCKSSPRPISIGPLHAFLHFHSRPIYLVVYKGSYQITLWETSS